ncbi:unnamed protein product [Cylicostephanus goldi]|uniref:Uncharacterized protein n=1 Tax=Cylicostephanus goldi TaxID=71465 RepID=A0A3P6SNZ8_CYLGO|nr:unnamed protein product [Cylicostephanus goldi]
MQRLQSARTAIEEGDPIAASQLTGGGGGGGGGGSAGGGARSAPARSPAMARARAQAAARARSRTADGQTRGEFPLLLFLHKETPWVKPLM